MRESVREVNFPMGLRGYERAAVDRYVQQVNRVIAELEISSSPESAIRHALEEVSEETSGLLQRAYETADEITARSRAKADDRLERAEQEAEELREAAAREAHETRETAERETQELREAAARGARELKEKTAREAQQVRETIQREVAEMREAAEARVSELDRDAEAIWGERRRLIEDMRAVAQQQLEIANAALARFPRTSRGAAEAPELPGKPPVQGNRAQGEPATADQPTTALPKQREQI
jgi:DivIVA domain-containing protein